MGRDNSYDSPPAYPGHHRGGHRDEYYNGAPDPRSGRGHNTRDKDDAYYSDDYDRRPRERRKSNVRKVLDLGIGGITAALASQRAGSRSRSRSRSRGHNTRDYDRHRGHDRYQSPSRGRSHSIPRTTQQKWQKVVQAAVVAGAVEAYRSRNEPGPWAGEKGTRVLTAAIGAAGVGGLVDKEQHKKGKRHMAEAILGGLAANRVANGPRDRSRSRSRFGRARSASRPRSQSVSDFFRGR